MKTTWFENDLGMKTSQVLLPPDTLPGQPRRKTMVLCLKYENGEGQSRDSGLFLVSVQAQICPPRDAKDGKMPH